MKRRRVVVSGVIAAVIAAVILLITVTPTPVDRPYRVQVFEIIRAVRHVPGFDWFDYDWLERLSNGVMFAPLGALLAYAIGRRWWIAIIACAALSALVELVQLVALPERTASLGDIMANTVGAAIGAVVVALVSRRVRLGRRADVSRRADG